MAGPSSGAAWAQSSLLDELLDVIDQDASNFEAQKLLAQQYQAMGWDDAAAYTASIVLTLSPNDREAQLILATCGGSPNSQPTPPRFSAPPHPPYSSVPQVVSPAANVQSVKQLQNEYSALREDAKNLLQEMLVFQELAPSAECAEQIAELTALSEGRMFSVARRTVGNVRNSSTSTVQARGRSTVKSGPPCSARTLAASMKVDPKTALDIAISDFHGVIHWNHDSGVGVSGTNAEAVRNALRKRVDALKSMLPKKMAHLAAEAFMHVEHEVLQKTYVNAETMYGDPVLNIPREEFWVSEDGYAWDMSELAQAIKANKGAFQNPLTRENFSATDVEMIIRHPRGEQLAAIQLEQNELIKGVRQQTIEMLRSTATIFLSDDSANTLPSHNAVDGFLAYVATLPRNESEAIDKMRVPAVDSHSCLPFNDTIGDAVRDAKGNRLCFHKAGDFLRQAAEFLSK